MAENTAQQLYKHLDTAENALEQVATLLAKAGADDETTKTFTRMADVCRQAETQLGKRGAEETDQNTEEVEAAAAEPGAEEAPAESEGVRSEDTSGPAKARTMDDATRELQSEVVRKKQQKAQAAY